jgi:hypothetical protein
VYVQFFGIACAAASLFGFFAPFSFLAMTLCAFVLGSFYYSFSESASHQFNLLLFALLGLCLTPICKKKYPWQVLPASVAISFILFLFSSFFFSAFCYKIFFVSGPQWIFSDNLRNLLIRQDFGLGVTTPIRTFIASHVLFYRSIAFLNCLIQASLISVILFIRKPYIRLILAFFYILECLSLYVVMGRFPAIFPGNLEWIILACFFVDWDFLFKRSSHSLSLEQAPQTDTFPKSASVFVILFFIFIFFCSVLSYINRKTISYIYPFGPFPMFSTTLSQQPYRQHLPFYFSVLFYHIDGRPVLLDSPESKLLNPESYPYKFDSISEQKTILSQKLNQLSTLSDKYHSSELSVHFGLYRIAPYPSSAQPVLIHSGKIGSYSQKAFSGTAMTLSEKERTITISLEGFPEPQKVVFLKRRITQDFLTTLGRKHSPVIHDLYPEEALRGRWLSPNTFAIDSSEHGTYLISAKMRNISYGMMTTAKL